MSAPAIILDPTPLSAPPLGDPVQLQGGPAGAPARLRNGKFAVFWRARCRITGAERTFRSHLLTNPDFETMRRWVSEFFRQLELLEVRPWSAEDEHRILFPVQRQYVKFFVKAPDLAAPEPRRKSLLVSLLRRGVPRRGRSLI